MKKYIIMFLIIGVLLAIIVLLAIYAKNLWSMLVGCLAGHSIFNLSDKFSTWLTDHE